MLPNDEFGATVTPSLYVDDPSIAENEQKAKALEKAYGELEAIRQEMVNTGVASTETVATLESMYPGILLDRYPRGGYTAENTSIALEEVGFKQVFLLGGIVAAIIGAIIGIFKMISSIFKSGGGPASVERVEKNNEKMEEKIESIKSNDKELDKIEDILGRGQDIPKEDLDKLIEKINGILDTDYAATMGYNVISKKLRERFFSDFVKKFDKVQSDITIQFYHNPFESKLIQAHKKFKEHIVDIIKGLHEDTTYIKKLRDTPMGPGFTNPEIKDPMERPVVMEIYELLEEYCKSRSYEYDSPLTLVQSAALPPYRTKQPIKITDVSQLEQWNKNCLEINKAIMIGDHSKEMDALVRDLEAFYRETELMADARNKYDLQHYGRAKEFTDILLNEARFVQQMLMANVYLTRTVLTSSFNYHAAAALNEYEALTKRLVVVAKEALNKAKANDKNK